MENNVFIFFSFTKRLSRHTPNTHLIKRCIVLTKFATIIRKFPQNNLIEKLFEERGELTPSRKLNTHLEKFLYYFKIHA